MQAFTQRLTFLNSLNTFQKRCTQSNVRKFSQTVTRSSVLSNHSGVSVPNLQRQVRLVSSSTATFGHGSRLRSSIWASKGLGVGGVLAGLGLGFAAFQYQRPAVLCEPPRTTASPANTPPRSDPTPTPLRVDDDAPPPPRSSVNVYELGFGTVAGICAGVFIKKGAKAIAFVLGGVFVLLQYLGSVRLVRVNWSRAESGFQDVFYSSSTDAKGKEVRRAPTVYSLFRWLIDFLTADFPPRATFIAGMALGLRLG